MNMELELPQEVSLIVLSATGLCCESTARIITLTGRRMFVACELPLGTGASVQLSWGSYMALAEVLSTDVDGGNVYALQVRHIMNMAEVEPLRKKWM